jgi:hypothetical protein
MVCEHHQQELLLPAQRMSETIGWMGFVTAVASLMRRKCAPFVSTLDAQTPVAFVVMRNLQDYTFCGSEKRVDTKALSVRLEHH